MHLRLHDHAAAQALGDLAGLGGRVGHVPVRHRHRELAQQCLRLILVDFHW
jgi:hypothetical protein